MFAQFSDIVAVKGESVFDRPIYAGQHHGNRRALDSIKVITVRSTAFPAGAEAGNSPSAELCATHKDRLMSRVTGRQAAVSDRPDLSFGAHYCFLAAEDLAARKTTPLCLSRFADKLGAALGASRAARRCWIRFERAAGRSNRKDCGPQILCWRSALSVRFNTWRAWRDSRIIVAINSDKDAPTLWPWRLWAGRRLV